MTFSVSPSSLSTFALCNRKWAFSAIDHIERVQHPSAALGERVHAIVENWLRDGTAPDLTTAEGAIAGRALKYLPKPTTCEVEHEFSFVAGDGLLLFNGRIDALTEDCVYDLKTTGDMRWAKTPEQLITDEQAIVYSRAGQLRANAVLPPALRWVYTKTKGAPSARKVDATLSEREVHDGMERLVATGLAMYRAKRDVRTALELDPNPASCRAFGGCPHIERCNLTNAQKMKGYMRKMGLKDKLKQINAPKPDVGETRTHEDVKPTEGAPTTNENPFRKRVAARANGSESGKIVAGASDGGQSLPRAETKLTAEEVRKGDLPNHGHELVETHKPPVEAPKTFHGIGTLYIGCIPLDGTFMYAETAFAEQMRGVAGAASVPHYRAVDYGKGPAYLIAAVAAKLESTYFEAIVIDLRTDLGRDLVGTLRERAALVVQGF